MISTEVSHHVLRDDWRQTIYGQLNPKDYDKHPTKKLKKRVQRLRMFEKRNKLLRLQCYLDTWKSLEGSQKEEIK